MIAMTDEELGLMLEEYDAEGAGFFTNPNYAKAILGLGENIDGEPIVVYDYELMAECLVEDDHMAFDEAYEWLDYNVIRSIPYMGPQAPVIVRPI